MKTIRTSIFETNSSSTHSICIAPKEWKKWNTNCDFDSPYKQITYEKLLDPIYESRIIKISTSNYYKRGDGYFLIQGSLEKCQFLLSCLSCYSNTFTTYLKGYQLEKIQSFYKAITDFFKNTYQIYSIDVDYSEKYGESRIVDSLIGYYWEDEFEETIPGEKKFTPEEIYKVVTRIITDNKIVFTCHSDETGPFPEDIGLIKINELEQLLSENNS